MRDVRCARRVIRLRSAVRVYQSWLHTYGVLRLYNLRIQMRLFLPEVYYIYRYTYISMCSYYSLGFITSHARNETAIISIYRMHYNITISASRPSSVLSQIGIYIILPIWMYYNVHCIYYYVQIPIIHNYVIRTFRNTLYRNI